MLSQNKKCVDRLTQTWQKVKIATPIAQALKCIVTGVISKTEPLQRRLPASPSPLDSALYQTWTEQGTIGWQNRFRERISKKWAEAQGIYYAVNSHTRPAKIKKESSDYEPYDNLINEPMCPKLYHNMVRSLTFSFTL